MPPVVGQVKKKVREEGSKQSLGLWGQCSPASVNICGWLICRPSTVQCFCVPHGLRVCMCLKQDGTATLTALQLSIQERLPFTVTFRQGLVKRCRRCGQEFGANIRTPPPQWCDPQKAGLQRVPQGQLVVRVKWRWEYILPSPTSVHMKKLSTHRSGWHYPVWRHQEFADARTHTGASQVWNPWCLWPLRWMSEVDTLEVMLTPMESKSYSGTLRSPSYSCDYICPNASDFASSKIQHFPAGSTS